VGVRRSGDGKLAPGAFDWARFVRDVQNGALKFLDESSTIRVCTTVQRTIENDLHRILQPLRPGEIAVHPGLSGWIADTDISEAVERQLRQGRNRLAHVMYALSIRGRADRDGRHGWLKAADVLRWLFRRENYPDLEVAMPTARMVPVDGWFPEAPAPEPSNVVKKDGHRRAFLLSQFEASIRKAMLGRPDADERSDLIAQWVLWGMKGQREVHTTQLTVGVLDCLRRVDDIAYLRWAAVAKGMNSVTQFRDEAIALIDSPSSGLRFDVESQPRRPNSFRTKQ
jgi:transcriptional regulator NrdR family protein